MPARDDPESVPLRGRRPDLADWLDLVVLLRHDEGLPGSELRRRDRSVGERVVPTGAPPERWLTAWVEARRAQTSGPAEAQDPALPGQRTADALRWISAALVLAGLFFGATAAWGALSFQPQGRINVVAVLALLVLLPTLLLVFALLNALPARLRRALPLIGAEREGGGLLQPARWALRALPQSARESLDAVFARGVSVERLAAPIQRWLLLSASQGAAVAFQVGALSAAIALVVFSDLSFGWSTTLRVEPATAHGIASALATPWAALWPDAVPSLALVEQTRFFRIASKPSPALDPELFGQWWRFVVAALVVYGLIPRVVFFAVASVRLRASLTRATIDAPGARGLLERMRDPLVELGHVGRDEAIAGVGLGADETIPLDSSPWPDAPVVVSWSEAIESSPGLAAQLNVANEGILAAGGRLAAAADLEAAARAAERARADDRDVAVVVRGFEPPVLEVVDFLVELRRRLGDGRTIVVGLTQADDDHARVWRRRIDSIGDPWTRCTRALPSLGGARSEGDGDV